MPPQLIRERVRGEFNQRAHRRSTRVLRLAPNGKDTTPHERQHPMGPYGRASRGVGGQRHRTQPAALVAAPFVREGSTVRICTAPWDNPASLAYLAEASPRDRPPQASAGAPVTPGRPQ